MSAWMRLTRMETKLFFREKQAVIWTFLYPVLMVWLFGVMYGKEKINGVSYSDAFIPSWIAVNLLTTALYTLGSVLTSYRTEGVLRRYQVTPVRAWAVLVAHTVYGLIIFVFSAVVLYLFGKWAFQLDNPKYLGSLLLAMILSVLALFPFGLFMTSLAKNARTAAAISTLLNMLMLFLSGATFPIDSMPTFLQDVAHVLPLYYVIDLTRGTWNVGPISNYGLDVAVLAGIAVVSIVLSTRFFKWSADPV